MKTVVRIILAGILLLTLMAGTAFAGPESTYTQAQELFSQG